MDGNTYFWKDRGNPKNNIAHVPGSGCVGLWSVGMRIDGSIPSSFTPVFFNVMVVFPWCLYCCPEDDAVVVVVVVNDDDDDDDDDGRNDGEWKESVCGCWLHSWKRRIVLARNAKTNRTPNMYISAHVTVSDVIVVVVVDPITALLGHSNLVMNGQSLCFRRGVVLLDENGGFETNDEVAVDVDVDVDQFFVVDILDLELVAPSPPVAIPLLLRGEHVVLLATPDDWLLVFAVVVLISDDDGSERWIIVVVLCQQLPEHSILIVLLLLMKLRYHNHNDWRYTTVATEYMIWFDSILISVSIL
jgi:hypothetical protein